MSIYMYCKWVERLERGQTRILESVPRGQQPQHMLWLKVEPISVSVTTEESA
jgi:hypothetical protein